MCDVCPRANENKCSQVREKDCERESGEETYQRVMRKRQLNELDASYDYQCWRCEWPWPLSIISNTQLSTTRWCWYYLQLMVSGFGQISAYLSYKTLKQLINLALTLRWVWQSNLSSAVETILTIWTICPILIASHCGWYSLLLMVHLNAFWAPNKIHMKSSCSQTIQIIKLSRL